MNSFSPSARPQGGLSRRRLIAGTGLGLAIALLPRPGSSQPAGGETAPDGFRILRARPGTALLRGDGEPATSVWSYGGGAAATGETAATVPSPLLRLRRGEELRVRLVNELTQPTTIHWHGVRVPNGMDGVPGLTQPPVAPGQRFDYRFRPPDAGTFWYHALFGSSEQAGRGLYGALIVDEPEPPAVDRDILLVFDDWRLTPAGEIDAKAAEHLTVNGRPRFDIPVRTNERVRLRLLNASRTRLFGVGIEGHRATVMAIDGQPAEPFEARDGRVVLAPCSRADLFVDAAQAAGSASTIVLATSRGQTPIARLVYDGGPPARPALRPEPRPLPANPLPERMDFARALKLDLPLSPDAPRSALGGQGVREPGLREAAAKGDPRARLWAQAAEFEAAATPGPPLFTVKRGRTVMLALPNRTAMPIAVHLHGHHARLLDALDDGWKPFWLDTVLVLPNQTVRIAFVADNPGKWLLYGHRVEQLEPGIVGWFEVA